MGTTRDRSSESISRGSLLYGASVAMGSTIACRGSPVIRDALICVGCDARGIAGQRARPDDAVHAGIMDAECPSAIDHHIEDRGTRLLVSPVARAGGSAGLSDWRTRPATDR